MSEPSEDEAVDAIKDMGLKLDEAIIRDTLRHCNNSIPEAVQLLLPESPPTEHTIDIVTEYSGGYSSLTHPYPRQHHSPQEDDMYDVDMKDTEIQQGSGAESDHDSTTVSYSLEGDRIREVAETDGDDEVLVEGHVGGCGHVEDTEEEQFGEVQVDISYGYDQVHGRRDVSPPHYKDIVNDSEEESESFEEQEGSVKRTTPTPHEVREDDVVLPAVEFPLTHYYELEGRVHTNHWSIPYKRDESLAICMIATIKMIRQGEDTGGGGAIGGGGGRWPRLW